MDQLNQYIEQCRQQGLGDDQIKQSLLASGWNPQQVESALAQSNASIPQPQPMPFSNPVNSSPELNNPVLQQATPTQQETPKLNVRLIIITVTIAVVFLIICVIIGLASHKSTNNGKAHAATSNQGALVTTDNRTLTTASWSL
jgi:hypothetical protein